MLYMPTFQIHIPNRINGKLSIRNVYRLTVAGPLLLLEIYFNLGMDK